MNVHPGNAVLDELMTVTANWRRCLNLALPAAFVLAWAFVPARAVAAEDPRDQLIRQLIERVGRLEAQVTELKSAKAIPEPIAAPATATPAGVELPELRDSYPKLQMRGFGDVSFRVSDREGDHNSFVLGQLDLFLTSRLAEDLSVLSENVIEAGDDNGLHFEIERLQLLYSPSDYLNFSFGRYHTAIGYYNTAYHHGTWFQTAVGRPRVFGFEDEGGAMPIHNVGLGINGAIPSGALGLRYLAEFGNGRHFGAEDEEPVLNVSDDNGNKSVNLALIARPDWAPNWQAGVSVYHDRLTPAGLPRIAQTIFAGHLVHISPQWELLAEALWFHHKPKDGLAADSTAFYVQVARQWGAFRPYARYEFIDVPEDDLVFGNFGTTGREHGPTLGLRYDFSELAAFKIQYDLIHREGTDTVNELTVQVGFTF